MVTFNYDIEIKLAGDYDTIKEFVGKLSNNVLYNDEDLLGENWECTTEDGKVYVITGKGWEECNYYPGDYWTPDDYDFVDGNFCECDLDMFIRKFKQDKSIEVISYNVHTTEDWDCDEGYWED
jgi:hypothetical protein